MSTGLRIIPQTGIDGAKAPTYDTTQFNFDLKTVRSLSVTPAIEVLKAPSINLPARLYDKTKIDRRSDYVDRKIITVSIWRYDSTVIDALDSLFEYDRIFKVYYKYNISPATYITCVLDPTYISKYYFGQEGAWYFTPLKFYETQSDANSYYMAGHKYTPQIVLDPDNLAVVLDGSKSVTQVNPIITNVEIDPYYVDQIFFTDMMANVACTDEFTLNSSARDEYSPLRVVRSTLKNSATAGDTYIDVDTFTNTDRDVIFKTGDKIAISDGVNTERRLVKSIDEVATTRYDENLNTLGSRNMQRLNLSADLSYSYSASTMRTFYRDSDLREVLTAKITPSGDYIVSGSDGRIAILSVDSNYDLALIAIRLGSGYVGLTEIFITTDSNYFICFVDDGIQVVDITNKSSPNPVGNYLSATGECHGDITSDNNYAIIMSDNESLKVIDITTKASPVLVGEVTDADFTSRVAGRGRVTSDGNYFIVAQSGHVLVVDITTKNSPVIIGDLSTGVAVDYGAGGIELKDDNTAILGYNGIGIVDITTKASPASLGSASAYFTTSSTKLSLTTDKSKALIAWGTELELFNISDINLPFSYSTKSASFLNYTNDAKPITNDYFVISRSGAIIILDIRNDFKVTSVVTEPTLGMPIEIKLRDEYDSAELSNTTLFKGYLRNSPTWNGGNSQLRIDNAHKRPLEQLLKCKASSYTYAYHPLIRFDNNGDSESSVSWIVQTGSGTFDYTDVTIYEGCNLGLWTLTFSSATEFVVSGVNTKDKAGNTAEDFYSEIDATDSQLKIAAAAWGGTPAASDVLIFTTSVTITEVANGSASTVAERILEDYAGIDSSDIDFTAFSDTNSSLNVCFNSGRKIGEAIITVLKHGMQFLAVNTSGQFINVLLKQEYDNYDDELVPTGGNDRDKVNSPVSIGETQFYNEFKVRYGYDFTAEDYTYEYVYPTVNNDSNAVYGQKRQTELDFPFFYNRYDIDLWVKRWYSLWAFGIRTFSREYNFNAMGLNVGDIIDLSAGI